MKEMILPEELERRVLKGLSMEWETALWFLEEKHRKQMRKPLFSIKDMKSMLGCWHPDHREISISRSLILNSSWEKVKETLLHEMAHQFTHEVLGISHEKPHGPSFKHACRLLRANPKASDNLSGKGTEAGENERIFEKIKKLLALAQSANRHEAELSMAKAHSLIAKYNVDIISLQKQLSYSSRFVGKTKLRHSREAYHLANVLQEYYFVSCVWVSSYIPEREKMGRVLEISGTETNLEIAHYVHDFITGYIDRTWHQVSREAKYGRSGRTDLALGIIEGFRSRMSASVTDKLNQETRELVKAGDPGLTGYLAYKYPRTKKTYKKSKRVNADLLNQGKEMGKNLVISKGISEKRTGNKLISR